MTHPNDALTLDEIVARDAIIKRGITQYRQALETCEKPQERMRAMGGMYGCEECRSFTQLEHFTGRCEQIQYALKRELAKGSEHQNYRLMYGLEGKEKSTNENKTHFFEGEMEQIRSMYDAIMLQRRNTSAPARPTMNAGIPVDKRFLRGQ